MARGQKQLEHLLRRAGFGASIADLTKFQDLSVNVVSDLVASSARLGDGYRVEARIVTWQSAEHLACLVESMNRAR